MNLLVATVLFFFTELSVIADGRRKKSPNFLKYQDCGSDSDRPIQIVEIDARPLPIRSPGKLKLSATINITEPLPEHINVDVSISKYFLGMPFKIPCIHNFGTCHYQDICSLLEIYNAGQRCPRMLRKRNIPCRCPFNQGVYTLETLRVLIPPLDGLLGMFAKGRYEASIRIYGKDKRELGCLHMMFKMKRRRKNSWLAN